MTSSVSSCLSAAVLDEKTASVYLNSHNNGNLLNDILSGEIFVRVCSEKLFQKAQLLDGLNPNLSCLLREKRKIDESVKPWQDKIRHIRQVKELARERRLQESQQWSLVYDSITNYTCTVNESKCTKNFVSKFDVLSMIYKKHLMSIAFQYYAILEAEKKVLMAWQRQEEHKCLQLVAHAQETFNINTFAMHLTRETSSKVRMWRLPEDDIQRQRCIKAATENIKKDFFVNASSHSHGAKGLEVIEVYKIENQTLLKSFHEYTVLQAQMGQQSSNQIKVKGLFCTIPIESLEHAIVYGMHAKKYQQEDEEILFSQKLIDIMAMEKIPFVEKQKNYARDRVKLSQPMKFPRRFSRYSTLEETRQECVGTNATGIHTTGSENKSTTGFIRYLLLCRVAMGKTLRIKQNVVSSTTETFPPTDLSIGSIQYCQEEEYLIRSPAAVVPEFLLQYHYVFENDHDIVQGFPSDFETNISRDVVDLNDLFQEKQILEEHQNTIIAFPFSQNFLPCWNGSSSQLFQGIASRSFRKTTPRSPLDMKTKKKHSSVLTDYRYKFKPEKIISNCIHQKQMLLDTIALLTKDLWSATKDAWKTNHPTSSKEKKTKQKNPR